MVILNSLVFSFVINGDGSTKSAAQINAPKNLDDYTDYARSAVVADQLYIFGGNDVSGRKIARLDTCTFVQLSVTLNHDFWYSHAALPIESGSKALICFGSTSPGNYCDVFNGVSVVTTHSSAYSHYHAGLAFYSGRPTTVGGGQTDGARKVETLTETGWQELADFSKSVYGHSLVGLPNGDMLLIGGYSMDESSYQNSIWRLGAVSGTWTEDGALPKTILDGSAILVDETIYYFGGYNDVDYPIQRIDLVGTDFTIEKTELIGYQETFFGFPILLVVDTNVCI